MNLDRKPIPCLYVTHFQHSKSICFPRYLYIFQHILLYTIFKIALMVAISLRHLPKLKLCQLIRFAFLCVDIHANRFSFKYRKFFFSFVLYVVVLFLLLLLCLLLFSIGTFCLLLVKLMCDRVVCKLTESC